MFHHEWEYDVFVMREGGTEEARHWVPVEYGRSVSSLPVHCRQVVYPTSCCWNPLHWWSDGATPSARRTRHHVYHPQSMSFVIAHIHSLHPSLYLLLDWAWWDWSLMWLTNRCPSVLWRCWLGHLTCKVVSKMTYNVSTRRQALLYHAIPKTAVVSTHWTAIEPWELVFHYKRSFHFLD